MPRVIASIEARMGSSRFPGKVLADVCGKPALTRLLRRLRRATLVDDIVVATSTTPADDAIESWAKEESVACYRGSENDVLRRVVEAHRSMKTEVVTEVTGDCILLDPEIVDMGVQTFLENECDVACNVRKESFPAGMDVQVFRLKDLADVEARIQDPAVREHVSLYFYEHPAKYRILHFFAPARWAGPHYRIMLDYPEDLLLINEMYRRLEPIHGDDFGIEEIMAVLKSEPELVHVNEHCLVKPVR